MRPRPAAVAAVAPLDPVELGRVEKCLRALLAGRDVPPKTGPATDQDKGVIATFTNSVLDKAVVFWENEDGEKVPVTGEIRKGTSERLSTHPGHKFLAYQGDKLLKSFTVTAQRGGWQEFEL